MEEKEKQYYLKQWHVVALSALVLSIIVFTASLGILVGLPALIEKNVREGAKLTEDSPLIPKWTNPKYAIKTRIWTYSVKNPDDVINGSKPIVKTMGPYVFDQKHRREIISNENGTVKFKHFKTYYFNEEDSCRECFLHNRIWIPNMIMQKFIEAASKPATSAASAALIVQTPFLEVEVSELLFDGYVDPFLEQVCSIPFVSFVCESILDLPDRIGLFHGKNGSSPGIFEVDNGERDGGESLGKIISFNGKKQMPEHWWSTEEARLMNGTEGSLFKPFITKEDKIEVFSADLCRSLKLTFKEEVQYGGLTAYRFVLPAENFDYSLPQNQGFCYDNGKTFYDEQKNSTCLPNGLLDISKCQKGEPPIVISMPNFLYTPDYVQNSIEGMRKPNPDLDEIQVDLEPRLGAVIRAQRRFQINPCGREKTWRGLDLSHFKNSIVPLISIEEYAEIDDETMSIIKENLIDMETAVRVAATSGVISSLLAGVIVVIYIGHRTGRIKKVIRQATVRQAKDSKTPPPIVVQTQGDWPKMNNRSTICCAVGLVLLALLAGGIGTFLLFILPSIIRGQIDQQTHLGFNASGGFTDTTQKWIAPQYKLSMNIYTFSIQNPDDVTAGKKPIIVEKGPEVQHKDVTFTEGNTRVLYKNKHFYYFDQASSCKDCKLDDQVTIPNIVLQKILDYVKDNLIARSIFDVIFKRTGEKAFLTMPVHDLLFDGYKDPLISKWCVDGMKAICDMLKIPDRIGLFYQRNGTDDGQYEIDTGLNDTSLIGKVYSFNGKKVVNAWYKDYARMVNGTDGQLYPPGLDRYDSNVFQLFIGQICRTIELEYYGQSSYQSVPVYLYHPARSMNNVDLQRGLGFCNPNSPIYFNNTYIQQKGCLPAGVMDVSSCLPGNPRIYMSQPHFLGSPSALREALVGMREPNSKDDGTEVGIEPSTGAVVFAQQKTQLNLGVTNGRLIALKNLSPQILPIVWFNESASFDPDTRDQLLGVTHLRSRTFLAGIVLYLLFGSVLIGLIAMLVMRRLRSQSENIEHRLLFSEDEEAEQNNQLIDTE
ncbi:Lysosome membrane protein 2 [Aphelenchoides bicaudatus]|nr:Lysosome membrane protein 2 [Aphelenchoides bicaudatus]